MKAIFYPSVDLGETALPFIHEEIYFDQIYRFLDGCRGLTIVDVGANIGEVTRFIRPTAKKIYAIEPSPMEFECLKENKEYNGWDNVAIFNLAISDREGETGFSITDGNRTGSHLDKDGKIRVKTKRLDVFLDENGIESVDFLKLDVEGSEEIILRSDFPASRVKVMLVEFHFPTQMELVAHTMSLGYKCHRMKAKADVYVFNR